MLWPAKNQGSGPTFLFPVITPLIMVRRGPENKVGATIPHLTLGRGGEHQGQNEGARLVLEATFRRPHDANYQGIGNEKMRIRKELNCLNLHK